VTVVRDQCQLPAYAVRRGSANTAVAPATAEMLDTLRQGSPEATGLKVRTMWRLLLRVSGVADEFGAGDLFLSPSLPLQVELRLSRNEGLRRNQIAWVQGWLKTRKVAVGASCRDLKGMKIWPCSEELSDIL
jgi:hypothetical protein